MSAALFPGPDEPQGSGLPGDGWDADEGIPQGLYVTAPAEDLSLEGFAEDGRADTMAPGPLLAMVLDTVAGRDGSGLAALSDDQLIGFLSGTKRMESRMAWARLAALGEFASRPRRERFRRRRDPRRVPSHLALGGGGARPGPRQDHRGRHQHPLRRRRRARR